MSEVEIVCYGSRVFFGAENKEALRLCISPPIIEYILQQIVSFCNKPEEGIFYEIEWRIKRGPWNAS